MKKTAEQLRFKKIKTDGRGVYISVGDKKVLIRPKYMLKLIKDKR